MPSSTDTVDLATFEAVTEIEARLREVDGRLGGLQPEHAAPSDGMADEVAILDARHAVHRALAAVHQLVG